MLAGLWVCITSVALVS